jgi:lipoate-protein ligase A
MTAALAELHARGAAADTIRFHRYPACVLLGRSQDAGRVADPVYCRQAGIAIARRVTGGGAVFMSPRILAWDVIIDRRAWGGDLAAVTRGIGEGIALGLSRLGAIAGFRPPNDIEIGGRKVSGSSGYVVGNSAVLQGTVLVDDEASVMARALRVPQAAIRGNVTCLAEAIGTAPSLDSIVACISLGLAESLQRKPVIENPSADVIALCEALLQEEIGTEEFVSGRIAG